MAEQPSRFVKRHQQPPADADCHEALARLGDRPAGRAEATSKPPPHHRASGGHIIKPDGEVETTPATCPRCARQLTVTAWITKKLPVTVDGRSTLREHKVAAGRHCEGCKMTESEFVRRGLNLYRSSMLVEQIKREHIPEFHRRGGV